VSLRKTSCKRRVIKDKVPWRQRLSRAQIGLVRLLYTVHPYHRTFINHNFSLIAHLCSFGPYPFSCLSLDPFSIRCASSNCPTPVTVKSRSLTKKLTERQPCMTILASAQVPGFLEHTLKILYGYIHLGSSQ